MKNTRPPQQTNRELLRRVDQINHLTIESLIGIDRLATRFNTASDLVFFNELASGLELMQSQLDYYLPAGEAIFELDEWADTLAVLNSGYDYTDDQVVELDARFDETQLSGCLRALSLSYVEAIPQLIAARLAHEELDPAHGKRRATRQLEPASRQEVATH
ncbi:MAG: hypothetical protein ACI9UA_000290 [Pseudoalteromonas tetraodonis]|jgi:hypothetical protein